MDELERTIDERGMVRREGGRLTPGEVLGRLDALHELVRSGMKENVDYGKVPGCGDKLNMLLPAAEKIGVMDQNRPEYHVTATDLGGGHMMFRATCTLYSIHNGNPVGQGVGNCTTMESKYRYRSQSTGRPVPKEYWQSRDKAVLGGLQYDAKKVGGEWVIVERVEHENPADYYNTCEKMCCKRSFIDAQKKRVAGSGLFTQDAEDFGTGPEAAPSTPPAEKTQRKTRPKPPQEPPAAAKAASDMFDADDGPQDEKEGNNEAPWGGAAPDPDSDPGQTDAQASPLEDAFLIEVSGKALMDKAVKATLMKQGFQWEERRDGSGKKSPVLYVPQDKAQDWADWAAKLKGKPIVRVYNPAGELEVAINDKQK